MDKPGKKLYLKLAKDAEWVADREKKYAKQALAEKKYAIKDVEIGRRNHQPARVANSLQEAKICDTALSF